MEENKTFKDALGKYNVFSRLMIVTVIAIYIYSYTKPLDIAYAEMSTWLFFGIFACVTFGINVFEHLGNFVQKVKGFPTSSSTSSTLNSPTEKDPK